MKTRLRAEIPLTWLPDDAPVASAVLAGFAAPLSWAHGLLHQVRLQTRLLTASGEMLDILAYDYLGARIGRVPPRG
ncbi:hypothetical protein, partial [Teichococcus rhizosphaerae]|uniref:hypothetical protein n=1 Tax=Teichococcus rhizosphaerae TaxID=1335062 RepID=UPI0038D1A335